MILAQVSEPDLGWSGQVFPPGFNWLHYFVLFPHLFWQHVAPSTTHIDTYPHSLLLLFQVKVHACRGDMREQIRGLKELCRNAFRTATGAAIFDPTPDIMIHDDTWPSHKA